MEGDDISSWSVSQTSADGNMSENIYEKDQAQADDGSFEFAEQNVYSDQKMSSRGGLRERMAARAGFSAPMLNTENIRPADIARKQDVRSPYLAIPPGLSPTCLLESPVFLSNSLVHPSPTTGKFSFALGGDFRSSTLTMENPEKTKSSMEDTNTSSFSFKPVADMTPSHFFNAAPRINPSTHPQQTYPIIETSIQSANTLHSQSAEPAKVESQNGASYQLQANFYGLSTENDARNTTVLSESRAVVTIDDGSEYSPPEEQQQDEAIARCSEDSMAGGAASEDGYNWRKYGQKQVKGSEFPRSYYKCTHTNCPVKKKVERSHEGHITEIIYKGAHNHPKTPPSRKSMVGSTTLLTDSQTGADGNTMWTTMQKDAGAAAPGWRHDSLEVTSSVAVGAQGNGPHFETGDAMNGSTTFSNEEDDQGTHGSASVGYDEGVDESESKRRKIEAYATDMSASTRAIREPRVVVQTTSEVDILDDGYRWRKYGQKVVKGNPNPRSYYKCTSPGCNVRKHVERASHDLKSVITTYEGKHNHDVPAARNSSQANAGNSGYGSHQGGGGVPTQLHRPEPSLIHNSMSRFDRPSSLGLPGMQQLGPPYGFPFGMNQAGLGNMGMAEWPYQGRLQQPGNGMGLVLPKGEPKVEPLSEPPLNVPNGYSL